MDLYLFVVDFATAVKYFIGKIVPEKDQPTRGLLADCVEIRVVKNADGLDVHQMILLGDMDVPVDTPYIPFKMRNDSPYIEGYYNALGIATPRKFGSAIERPHG